MVFPCTATPAAKAELRNDFTNSLSIDFSKGAMTGQLRTTGRDRSPHSTKHHAVILIKQTKKFSKKSDQADKLRKQ